MHIPFKSSLLSSDFCSKPLLFLGRIFVATAGVRPLTQPSQAVDNTVNTHTKWMQPQSLGNKNTSAGVATTVSGGGNDETNGK